MKPGVGQANRSLCLSLSLGQAITFSWWECLQSWQSLGDCKCLIGNPMGFSLVGIFLCYRHCSYQVYTVQARFPICFPPVHHVSPLTAFLHTVGGLACEQLPHVQQSAVLAMDIKMSNLLYLQAQAVEIMN